MLKRLTYRFTRYFCQNFSIANTHLFLDSDGLVISDKHIDLTGYRTGIAATAFGDRAALNEAGAELAPDFDCCSFPG